MRTKEYRHNSNPDEKIFYDEFLSEYLEENLMGVSAEQIAFRVDGRGNPEDQLSEREAKIMLNTIQWLGSPVGKSFLEKCGFVKKNN